jgi:hypothetical protein
MKATASEKPALDTALTKAVDALDILVRRGLAIAMNMVNAAPREPRDGSSSRTSTVNQPQMNA